LICGDAAVWDRFKEIHSLEEVDEIQQWTNGEINRLSHR